MKTNVTVRTLPIPTPARPPVLPFEGPPQRSAELGMHQRRIEQNKQEAIDRQRQEELARLRQLQTFD